MKMTHERTDGDITLIRLAGRLDREGSEAIDHDFTAHAASHQAWVVVDLSAVTFLASVGMRTLISAAKAQTRLGGRLVLLAPAPKVRDTLTTAGIHVIIPVFDDLEAATRSLRGNGP